MIYLAVSRSIGLVRMENDFHVCLQNFVLLRKGQVFASLCLSVLRDLTRGDVLFPQLLYSTHLKSYAK